MLYMLFVCADIITKDNKKIVHDKVLQGKNKLHYTHWIPSVKSAIF